MLLNEVIPMGSLTKQTISAQIPIELAAAVENLAIELDRSKSWIIKEALTSMLAEENGVTRASRPVLRMWMPVV